MIARLLNPSGVSDYVTDTGKILRNRGDRASSESNKGKKPAGSNDNKVIILHIIWIIRTSYSAVVFSYSLPLKKQRLTI